MVCVCEIGDSFVFQLWSRARQGNHGDQIFKFETIQTDSSTDRRRVWLARSVNVGLLLVCRFLALDQQTLVGGGSRRSGVLKMGQSSGVDPPSSRVSTTSD